MKPAKSLTDQQHKDLYHYVDNAAKAIGWKKEVNSDTYDDILTEYNKGAKAISYDYKLRGSEQAVIKDDMTKDRTNYKYIDEKGDVITDPEKLASITDPKSFSPDTRVYGKDGKSRISFTFKDNGELKHGLAENLAYEDNNYHKTVGNLQKDALNFYKTGTVESPEANMFSEKMGFNKSNYKGVKPISVQLSPTGKSLFVILGDKEDRKNQVYQELILDNKGNPIAKHNIPNLPTMMKLINRDWYTTSEGQSEATRIAQKKTQYESLLDNNEE